MASIKESFENKLAAELNLPRVYSLKLFCATKETEKAVYAILYTGYMADGRRAKHRAHWVPKSAIENPEIADELEAEVKAKMLARGADEAEAASEPAPAAAGKAVRIDADDFED